MIERSTKIWYEIKEEVKVSLSEYVVIELIDRLCPGDRLTTQRSPFPCTASKASLAEYLGMSKAGVFRIVKRLVKRGLLVQGKGHGRYCLSPGDKWYEAIASYIKKEKENGQPKESET